MKANIIFFALLLLSCNSGSNKRKAEVERFTKLEEFLLLPFDSVMNMYDLSNDSIVDFPDLSSYTIKSLNLSGNLLDTIIPHFLPKGLERLNLSNNKYKGSVNIRRYTIPSLKEVDLS